MKRICAVAVTVAALAWAGCANAAAMLATITGTVASGMPPDTIFGHYPPALGSPLTISFTYDTTKGFTTSPYETGVVGVGAASPYIEASLSINGATATLTDFDMTSLYYVWGEGSPAIVEAVFGGNSDIGLLQFGLSLPSSGGLPNDLTTTFTLSGIGGFGIIDLDQGTFTIGLDGITVQQLSASPAPEPSVWALLIAGFGLVGSTLRRVRDRSARSHKAAWG